MISGFYRFLFALSSLAPVALTWAIADVDKNGFALRQAYAIAIAVGLLVICYGVLSTAHRSSTRVSFAVTDIKAVDNEVVAYIVTYLFPLIAPADGVGVTSLIFVFLLLAIVMATSNAFTFNPLLTILQYRFYEVRCTSGVTYLLLSKHDISDLKQVASVGRLSRHLVLHLK